MNFVLSSRTRELGNWKFGNQEFSKSIVESMSNFGDILNYFFCGTNLPQVQARLVVPGVKIPVDCLSTELLNFLDDAFQQTRQSLKSQPIEANLAFKDDHKSGHTEEILRQLLKDHPVCTSAVLYCDGYFCVSTVASRSETLLTKLMSAYDPSFPRVHAQFDVRTWELCSVDLMLGCKSSFQYSNSVSKDEDKFLNRGSETTTHNTEEDSSEEEEPMVTKEKALTYLLFSLLWYMEVIHATLHVFELLMMTGIIHAMESLPARFLKPLKDQLRGICVQAKETEGLFARNGLLCGGCWKADRTAVLQFVKTDLLTKWFHYNSADEFVQDFIFHNIPRKYQRTLAEAYLKHISLIYDSTSHFCYALERFQATALIHRRLRTFMTLIGIDVSTVSTLQQWFSVFGALGYFHQSATMINPLLANSEISSLLLCSEKKKTSSIGTNEMNTFEGLNGLVEECGPWATITALCDLFPEIFSDPQIKPFVSAECDSVNKEFSKSINPDQPMGKSFKPIHSRVSLFTSPKKI
jgi:hypothetical protein